ncbi:MAG TPA: hypothetical protein VF692_05570, partial [Pyrinomonadaceae bacterium]
MKIRGIKTSLLFAAIAAFFVLITSANAQTVLVNYSFNVADACTAAPAATATNITSTFSPTSGSCSTATTGNAATTVPPAFVVNAAGSAPSLSGVLTPSYQFTLGGANLNTYTGYQLFFQLRSTSTGPSTATLEYSVNGGAFTAVPNGTFAVPQNGTVTNYNFDLSSVSALNNATSIVFRITGSGGSS